MIVIPCPYNLLIFIVLLFSSWVIFPYIIAKQNDLPVKETYRSFLEYCFGNTYKSRIMMIEELAHKEIREENK